MLHRVILTNFEAVTSTKIARILGLLPNIVRFMQPFNPFKDGYIIHLQPCE